MFAFTVSSLVVLVVISFVLLLTVVTALDILPLVVLALEVLKRAVSPHAAKDYVEFSHLVTKELLQIAMSTW